MNISQFQVWLNARGASLSVDGKGGPATRDAIIRRFICRDAKPASDADKTAIAQRLGGTLKQLNAVSAVESSGGGWDQSGLLKILYERHYVWRRLKVKIPLLSDPAAGGYTIDADRDGLNDSWEKLANMACRNPQIAFESVSWGKFQVMGAWWSKLGYPTVFDMAWGLRASEAAHYELLARYIEVNRLNRAFQSLSGDPADCLAFARGYNGPAQKGYDQRLAKAMREG